jgi:hypothetical protein
MNKKIVIQTIFFFILLIIIFFFYYEYFFSKKKIISLTNQDQNIEVASSENNLIKNLEYLSKDKNGNKYLITAEYGEVSQDNIILMTNVNAQIDFLKNNTVYLTSDFASYNTVSLDTNFKKNVILQYTGHEITSENIDLSFKRNFAWIYNNIIYKSFTNELFADKLEINLLTKDSKIFMYDNKKLRIIGK